MALTDAIENQPKSLTHEEGGFLATVTEESADGPAIVNIKGRFEYQGQTHALFYTGHFASWAEAKADGNVVLQRLIADKAYIASQWNA